MDYNINVTFGGRSELKVVFDSVIGIDWNSFAKAIDVISINAKQSISDAQANQALENLKLKTINALTQATSQDGYVISQNGVGQALEGFHIKGFNLSSDVSKVLVSGVSPITGALCYFVDNLYNEILPVTEYNKNKTYADFEVTKPANALRIYICGNAENVASCKIVSEVYALKSETYSQEEIDDKIDDINPFIPQTFR